MRLPVFRGPGQWNRPLDQLAAHLHLTVTNALIGAGFATGSSQRFLAPVYQSLRDLPGGVHTAGAVMGAVALLMFFALWGSARAVRTSLLMGAVAHVFVAVPFYNDWVTSDAAPPLGWIVFLAIAAGHLIRALPFARSATPR